MAYDNLRRGRSSESYRIYFVTTVLRNRSELLFQDLFIGRLVVREMRKLDQAGCVNSLAWVLMPDHLHWLFQLMDGQRLDQVMKMLKVRSATRINAFVRRRGNTWQRAYFDHALRREEDVKQIARYIVANPLRSGLVRRLGDYPHWDAVWV